MRGSAETGVLRKTDEQDGESRVKLNLIWHISNVILCNCEVAWICSRRLQSLIGDAGGAAAVRMKGANPG